MTLAPEFRPGGHSRPHLMMSPTITAVCFDVDATLVDYEASTRAGLRELLGDDDAWVDWCALTDRHYLRYLAGEVDFDTMRRERTKEFLASRGEILADGEVLQREERRAAAMRRAWQLYDDALPCLRALRADGLKLAAITNAAGPYQRAKLEALGLQSVFDAVLISGELGVAKPARAIFRTACAALGVHPWQAVHVGDRLDLDAEGARDAGLHGVWLDRARTGVLPKSIGISVIAHLSELPALVGRLAAWVQGRRVELSADGQLASFTGAGASPGRSPESNSLWGMV